MKHFKSIDEVLSSDFGLLGDGYEEKKKTDRVLKSTKIEQAIFEDLRSDCELLPEYEKDGNEKLKTFGSLVNDVFQSVYGMNPRYTPDEDISLSFGITAMFYVMVLAICFIPSILW